MAEAPLRLIPMAHVQSVVASIAFYAKLGFRVRNTNALPDRLVPNWAMLEGQSAQLMLSLASEPVVPEQQAVLFYVYYNDVEEAHRTATALGLKPSSLTYPFYCPCGEFRVMDMYGYCLMITHTS